MRACALAIAVKNARAEVKMRSPLCHAHTKVAYGALRNAVEYVLKAQGKMVRA